MSTKLNSDNFLLGVITGLISLFLIWFGLRSVRLSLIEHYGNPYFFPPPRIELITILINVIIFRIMIVNLKKEKTGRGILFITVILSLAFFYLFFKFNYRLP